MMVRGVIASLGMVARAMMPPGPNLDLYFKDRLGQICSRFQAISGLGNSGCGPDSSVRNGCMAAAINTPVALPIFAVAADLGLPIPVSIALRCDWRPRRCSNASW
jgi:hypothetical protein